MSEQGLRKTDNIFESDEMEDENDKHWFGKDTSALVSNMNTLFNVENQARSLFH